MSDFVYDSEAREAGVHGLIQLPLLHVMDAMIAVGLVMWLLCVVRDGAAMESDSGRNNWAILVDTSR